MSKKFPNIAVGILRPPKIFFFEIDNKDILEVARFGRFIETHFHYYSVYETKNGFHVIAYPFKRKIWNHFKREFKTDFTMKLRKRWGKGKPQVLRISEKWDQKTGRVTSPRPKLIQGNLFLLNVNQYKVIYFAK